MPIVAKSKVAAIISMGGDILPSFSKMRFGACRLADAVG
jgi:hypothetical protein